MTNNRSEPQSIAFCGSRGLPARYGGFETAVDEITRRFVRAGKNCVVFCRARTGEELPRNDYGRQLVYVKGSRHRKLDTFVSSFQTGWHLFRNRRQYRYVFWFNNANLPGIMLTWLARLPMSINTDGLEWRRAKWSWPFKLYYFLSSFLIANVCRSLIADSRAIQSYYQDRFGAGSDMIPYGAPALIEIGRERSQAILDRLNLERDRYFLQITRFEPDNLPYETGTAFQQSGLAQEGFAMVIVGYQGPTRYADTVMALHGRHGVSVLNATYDPEILHVLRQNCFCYVHGNSVGGTNPALLEAMGTCPRILAIESPFSREVLGLCGLYFDPQDPVDAFRSAATAPSEKEALCTEVWRRYQWDAVAKSYMRLASGLPADYDLQLQNRAATDVPNKRSSEAVHTVSIL